MFLGPIWLGALALPAVFIWANYPRAFRLNHWVGFAVFAGTAVDLALR